TEQVSALLKSLVLILVGLDHFDDFPSLTEFRISITKTLGVLALMVPLSHAGYNRNSRCGTSKLGLEVSSQFSGQLWIQTDDARPAAGRGVGVNTDHSNIPALSLINDGI